jgi:hypothetical protein
MSVFRANAEHMNNDSNYDVGLWQINTQNWADWYVCLIARQRRRDHVLTLNFRFGAATVATRRVISTATSTVPSRSGAGVATRSHSGPPVALAAAAERLPLP